MEEFEKFCKEYNLEYDFKKLSNLTYVSNTTQMAYIVFKYSWKWNYGHKPQN